MPTTTSELNITTDGPGNGALSNVTTSGDKAASSLGSDIGMVKPQSESVHWKKTTIAFIHTSTSHLAARHLKLNKTKRSLRTAGTVSEVIDTEAVGVQSAATVDVPISPISPQNSNESSPDAKPTLKKKERWSVLRHRASNTKDGSTKLTTTEKIEADVGDSITARHNMNTASIEGDFSRIEYGQLDGRPACLIIIDLRLVYQPESTIDRAKIELQFGSEENPQDVPPPIEKTEKSAAKPQRSPISKIFAPLELEGRPHLRKTTRHSHIAPKVSGLGFAIGTGGGGSQIATTEHYRWRVQGRREQHNGIYDTFGWKILENEMSKDSVPRMVHLGMIAFHEPGEPFWMRTTIEGKLRGALHHHHHHHHHHHTKVTKEKRWFYPPPPPSPSAANSGTHILQREMVEKWVSMKNSTIGDVAPGSSHSEEEEEQQQQAANLLDFTVESGMGSSGAGMALAENLGPAVISLLEYGTAPLGLDGSETALSGMSC